jgi:hypothetical protein
LKCLQKMMWSQTFVHLQWSFMFAEALQPKIFRCSILIKFASCFYFSLVLFVCDGFGPIQNQVCFGHLGF